MRSYHDIKMQISSIRHDTSAADGSSTFGSGVFIRGEHSDNEAKLTRSFAAYMKIMEGFTLYFLALVRQFHILVYVIPDKYVPTPQRFIFLGLLTGSVH